MRHRTKNKEQHKRQRRSPNKLPLIIICGAVQTKQTPTDHLHLLIHVHDKEFYLSEIRHRKSMKICINKAANIYCLVRNSPTRLTILLFVIWHGKWGYMYMYKMYIGVQYMYNSWKLFSSVGAQARCKLYSLAVEQQTSTRATWLKHCRLLATLGAVFEDKTDVTHLKHLHEFNELL